MNISDSTPVLIGAGEFSERLDDADYQCLSPLQLAERAGRAAMRDTGAAERLAATIDVIATVRTFEDSAPSFIGEFGRAKNFPRAIAGLLSIDPREAIWDVAGGQSPQTLVSELAEKIAAAEVSAALLVGAEAISTARYLQKEGRVADWSSGADGAVDDRGPGLDGLVTEYILKYKLGRAPATYGLFDNARRGRLGMDEAQYRRSMGELFAPFSKIAARNPHSMSSAEYSAQEIATVSADNRMIASPYTRRMVSRDQVNQSAALIMVSVAKARELGVDKRKWVYLHGYAKASERMIHDRQDLSKSPASVAAARAALASAGVSVEQIRFFDLYSCFPAPVYNICDALNISPNDERGLTVTGGLPYFGGAGNNYSMHAIAAMLKKLRHEPGSLGFVGANGGFMSKYAAAVYSTRPKIFQPCDSDALQREIDAWPAPALASDASGEASIETYTVIYHQGAPGIPVVVGRLQDNKARFFAMPSPTDAETLKQFMSGEPLGRKIYVRPGRRGNCFAFSEAHLTAALAAQL